MSFEKFIKDNYTDFVAKKTATINVIPVEGQKSFGKINVTKGDKVKVTEHNTSSRNFMFKDVEYMLDLPTFTKHFARK